MKKSTKNIIWVLVLLALAYGVWVYIVYRNENSLGDDIENVEQEEVIPKMEGKVEDLISFSVKPGAEVSGLTPYQGSVKGGWFFEANILINVLDANKKVLLKGHANATTEWMTIDPVEFGGNIDFTNLPKGSAFIQIHNDNPSDMRENDKEILIPVTIL